MPLTIKDVKEEIERRLKLIAIIPTHLWDDGTANRDLALSDLLFWIEDEEKKENN